MRIRILPLLLILASSPALVAEPVSAQPGGPDAATEMARQRFAEGVKLFDQGDYQRAQVAFLQAWALKKHPAVLLNLAQCELRAGDHVAAARHFSQYLRDYPDTPAKERDAAQKGLEEAQRNVGLLEVVAAQGAEVLVDGESVGRAPLAEPIAVKPGTHEVEVRIPGMPPIAKQTTVTGGSKNAVTFDVGLAEPAAVPPPPPDAVEEVAEEETEAEAAETEKVEEAAPAGGRKSFVSWVASDPVAWGTLGATGIGLGAGVTFAFLAGASATDADSIAAQVSAVASRDDGLLNYKDLDRRSNPCADPIPVTAQTDYRPACGQLRDKLDTRDSRKTIMWVGFGVAAAGAVGTGVAYYLRSETEEEPVGRREPRGFAAITPVWTPEVTGLGVTGTF